jgi:hypothetical protein
VEAVFGRLRHRIPEPAQNEARARAALGAKAVLLAGDAFTRGERELARRVTLLGARAWPAQRQSLTLGLLESAALGDECAHFMYSRDVLSEVCTLLGTTRFTRRLEKRVAVDPSWERALHETASRVRRFVPPGRAIATVDKWDPTLLKLSERRGRHFPDRTLPPDGYPPDSEAAVRPLSQLADLGVEYIVFPTSFTPSLHSV